LIFGILVILVHVLFIYFIKNQKLTKNKLTMKQLYAVVVVVEVVKTVVITFNDDEIKFSMINQIERLYLNLSL
jgi:hypothetical protein